MKAFWGKEASGIVVTSDPASLCFSWKACSDHTLRLRIAQTSLEFTTLRLPQPLKLWELQACAATLN